MESIFHEKQEGSLCAQHCLNALLQGNYFTAVDLAGIAENLDQSETQHMAEAGTMTTEYQQFIKQPSNNYDDSGYFSIQVIQKAVGNVGLTLELITAGSEVAQKAREDPVEEQGFICNFKNHWFCIRKLGNQWFNLNSLLTGPELISNTYLSIFLKQLQQEGHSIYVVLGTLIQCDADQILRLVPAVQSVKPKIIQGFEDFEGASGSGTISDKDLRKAIQQSNEMHDNADESLQKALVLSMADHGIDFSEWHQSTSHTDPSAEQIRINRQQFLDKLENKDSKTDTKTERDICDDQELEKAIELSMNTDT